MSKDITNIIDEIENLCLDKIINNQEIELYKILIKELKYNTTLKDLGNLLRSDNYINNKDINVCVNNMTELFLFVYGWMYYIKHNVVEFVQLQGNESEVKGFYEDDLISLECIWDIQDYREDEEQEPNYHNFEVGCQGVDLNINTDNEESKKYLNTNKSDIIDYIITLLENEHTRDKNGNMILDKNNKPESNIELNIIKSFVLENELIEVIYQEDED